MTTETTTHASRERPRGVGAGSGILAAAAAASLGVGILLAVLGGAVAGLAPAYGALAGTLLAVAVFALGSLAVNVVAGLLPSASLLVAMLTYTLQVVLVWLAFVALSGSGLLEESLDAGWLAAGVIASTLVWLGAQLLLATRARIPAYDLPVAEASDRPEAGAE